MGTHGCVAITKSDGAHICCERTMDGYCSMDAMIHWLQTGLQEEDYPDPDEIGAGGIQFNEGREHDQEYYYHVDFRDKIIQVSTIPVESNDIGDILLLLVSYIRQGWRVEIAYDCEHEEVIE